MGILPAILYELNAENTIIETDNIKNEIKKTFKFNFETMEFETDTMNNVLQTSTPEEVLHQVVSKVLHDTRYKYLAYPNDYGSEIQLIFQDEEPMEVIECELERLYEEALLYHPLIDRIEDFETVIEESQLFVTFLIYSTNGAILYVKREVEGWIQQ